MKPTITIPRAWLERLIEDLKWLKMIEGNYFMAVVIYIVGKWQRRGVKTATATTYAKYLLEEK